MEISTQNPSHAAMVTEGEVIVVETVAPIPIPQLRRKFTENIEFEIDYDGGRFKQEVFITYLNNLDIKCRLKFSSLESRLELLAAYLRLPAIANVPEMEDLAMNIMLAAYGKAHFLNFDPMPFINENIEIIEVWLRRLCALPLFALHCHPKTKDLVQDFPEDDDNNMAGINYVQLIKHELFPLFVENFDIEDASWNKQFFNKDCFNGTNLFNYFATPNNPLFVAVMAMDKPENMKQLLESAMTTHLAQEQVLKGISHVPSV